MSEKKNDNSQSKKKAAVASVFQPQSRFGGGGSVANLTAKSQYKPTPVRITQHKG